MSHKHRMDERIRWVAQAHGGSINKGDAIISERELSIELGFDRQATREVLSIMAYIGLISSQERRSRIALCDFDDTWGNE